MIRKKFFTVIILTLTLQWIVFGADNPGSSHSSDFGNRGTKHYGDFHIDLPGTWSPAEMENPPENSRIISYTAEYNTHTVDLNIHYSAAGSTELAKKETDAYRKDIVQGKTRLHFLRSDGYEDATHNARFFYHLFEDIKRSGFSVTGVLSSKNGEKMAIVKLTVSFPKGSPLTGSATEYLKKSTDIVKSFRIEGL